MNIFCFDIGIENMGYANLIIDDYAYSIIEIREIGLCDLKVLEHTKVDVKECKLGHSNELIDRFNHFMQERPQFEKADLIIVERQPITSSFGITLQNLYMSWAQQRKIKYLLQAPNSLNKFYFRSKDYDTRKTQNELQAFKAIIDYGTREVEHYWDTCRKKYDMADAIVHGMYFLAINKKMIKDRMHKSDIAYKFKENIEFVKHKKKKKKLKIILEEDIETDEQIEKRETQNTIKINEFLNGFKFTK